MKIKTEYILGFITIGLTAILYYKFNKKNKINPSGMSVAFIGDSQLANFTSSAWQNQLINKYKLKPFSVPQNNETGASKTSNLAMVGKTTSWMEKILNTFYRDWLYRPDILFIYGGGNDITNGATPNNVIKNIQDMVNIARQFGTKHVYVISGFRSSKVSQNSTLMPDDILRRDQYKTRLLKEIKGAHVVPIWEEADASYSPDGLHITNASKLKRLADYIGNKIFTS